MHTIKGKSRDVFILLASILVPCSGYVMIGRPMRGLMMLLWLFALGYITFHLTSPEAPFLYRFSGGLVVWAFSIYEIVVILKKEKQ